MIASLLFVFTAAAEISTSCGLNLFLNLQPKFTRNCYMTTTELLKIPDNLASTSPQTFYKLCLESCQETIKTASSLISTPSCASSTFDDDGKINGSIVSNFLQLAPAACLRTSDGNGFCLQSQLPVLLPILETITDSLSVVRILFGKRNEVCNDCVKRELDATKGIDLIYLDEKV